MMNRDSLEFRYRFRQAASLRWTYSEHTKDPDWDHWFSTLSDEQTQSITWEIDFIYAVEHPDSVELQKRRQSFLGSD